MSPRTLEREGTERQLQPLMTTVISTDNSEIEAHRFVQIVDVAAEPFALYVRRPSIQDGLGRGIMVTTAPLPARGYGLAASRGFLPIELGDPGIVEGFVGPGYSPTQGQDPTLAYQSSEYRIVGKLTSTLAVIQVPTMELPSLAVVTGFTEDAFGDITVTAQKLTGFPYSYENGEIVTAWAGPGPPIRTGSLVLLWQIQQLPDNPGVQLYAQPHLAVQRQSINLPGEECILQLGEFCHTESSF